ncbi:ParA family protein [Aureimonas sp. AU40]|uniref:ParA family protein n=1 Tax=Aureimonas sp. AU40 TaxID=1637747 RepID=UPI000785F64C|nr:ParA family protein [Aureimonas sp. AU40]
MADQLMISCLSQKGGVGKSTFARLIAQTFSAGGWSVKIADFNVRQLTAVDWAASRKAAGIEPEIEAEAFSTVRALAREKHDLIVADGRPDSDQTSLELAKASRLVVVPTGTTFDDLKPQVMFANELVAKGIDKRKILFVINKTAPGTSATEEARAFLESGGYEVAKTDLTSKTGYQLAQNQGRSAAETTFGTLNERATEVANEIAKKLTSLMPELDQA